MTDVQEELSPAEKAELAEEANRLNLLKKAPDAIQKAYLSDAGAICDEG